MDETTADTEFKEFPKMARFSRDTIISEKVDGTNSLVALTDQKIDNVNDPNIIAIVNGLTIRAGSRTRWITPSDDNFGFAKWVEENKLELVKLGAGRHFGEWWGSGINRGYGLQKGEKRFSLFNVIRWAAPGTEPKRIVTEDPRIEKYQEVLPSCCSLVPELYRGKFDTVVIEETLERLKTNGSYIAPGFMRPEGIVIFHIAGNVGFKKTIEKDEIPKSLGIEQDFNVALGLMVKK